VFSYLRGTFKGHEPDGSVIIEVGGVGYSVIVPPIVDGEIASTCAPEAELLLHVSPQSTRDQPWPVLFGFLSPHQKAFWELLISVPRVGGKLAARAMVAPIDEIAQAIQSGNRAYLDGLPGITLDGADKIIASLRKKVGPFAEPVADGPIAPRARRTDADEVRDDAVALLVSMGLKRPEAQRGVDRLLDTRSDITSLQDIITEFFRAQHSRAEEAGP
jgi:Holliday junction DNA helicase RuvA